MKIISILHIISDEKFLESCRRTFDVPQFNNYFLETLKGNETYIESHSINVLCIHYLRKNEIELINKSNFSIPVIWFFWGADGFRLGRFHNKFLLPKTNRIKLKLSFQKSFINGFKELLKRALPPIIDYLKDGKGLIKALAKIDIIVPVVPGDVQLLKSLYPIKAEVFHVNYITPVFFKNSTEVNGNNILLGNSATYTNNHIEVLDILKKLNLGSRKVVIPLNYGNDKYAKFIKNYAETVLPDMSMPIQEFLPFEEYSKIVQSCEIIIMNHVRQQGLGNIILALYRGATVYLREESTVYEYLKQNSFYVLSIQNLKQLKVLSQSERNFNKKRCNEIFGINTQHKKVAQLVAKALSKRKGSVANS